MARTFNGTSNFAGFTGLNLNLMPKISLSMWLNWTAFANNDHLAVEHSSNYNSFVGGFIIDPNNSSPNPGTVAVGVRSSSSAFPAGYCIKTFARPAAGVYVHWLVVLDASQTGGGQVVAVYLNGVSQSLTAAVSNGAVLAGFASDPMNIMCRGGASLFAAGTMADLAIWNVNLGQLEATALSNGARPGSIQATNLIRWVPIFGLIAPETVFPVIFPVPSGTGPFIVTGTTRGFDPPFEPLRAGFGRRG